MGRFLCRGTELKGEEKKKKKNKKKEKEKRRKKQKKKKSIEVEIIFFLFLSTSSVYKALLLPTRSFGLAGGVKNQRKGPSLVGENRVESRKRHNEI